MVNTDLDADSAYFAYFELILLLYIILPACLPPRGGQADFF